MNAFVVWAPGRDVWLIFLVFYHHITFICEFFRRWKQRCTLILLLLEHDHHRFDLSAFHEMLVQCDGEHVGLEDPPHLSRVFLYQQVLYLSVHRREVVRVQLLQAVVPHVFPVLKDSFLSLKKTLLIRLDPYVADVIEAHYDTLEDFECLSTLNVNLGGFLRKPSHMPQTWVFIVRQRLLTIHD